MPQVTSQHPRDDFKLLAENTAITVVQTGNTQMLDVDTSNIERLAVEAVVTGFALDAFVITGKIHPSSTAVTLKSAAGDYTSPTGVMIVASGDLTTQAVGTGWFLMDVRPFSSVQVLASSGNVAGSTVTARASGR
jgi:hypothetical protein